MPPSAQDQVIANYQAQHAALVAGDYDALAKLLSDGFTRTHFTGRTLTKAQWLKQLRSGELTYHSFEEVNITVNVEDSRASLVGRTICDATLYGERQHWRLQLRQTFLRDSGVWLVTHATATVW